MKIGKITKAFEIAIAADDNVHMIGPHGIGKTEIAKAWAKDNGYHLEVLQLPILEVSDLVGMPTIEDSVYGKVTTWAAPEWVKRVHEAHDAGKEVVVFLDELGRASVDVRQASLQLVLEKKVNEHDLTRDGRKTLFVVADNPADEYDSAEFDMALEDRFQTYNVDVDVDAWLNYARKNDVEDVVTAYIAEMTEKLHFIPDSDGEKGSSPRAWKKLSDGLKVTKDEDFVPSLIFSKVGKTVGSNFHHFYRNYTKIVKVDDILTIIGDSPIKTAKAQKAIAKKLGKTTKKIEVISAQELANKMLDAHLKDPERVTSQHVICYVGSLGLEIITSVFKMWRNSEDEKVSEYYYGNLQDDSERWISSAIVAQVKK